VAKFWKDSIFRAEIFAKLSLKYRQNFRCRNTNFIALFTSLFTHLFHFKQSPSRCAPVENKLILQGKIMATGFYPTGVASLTYRSATVLHNSSATPTAVHQLSDKVEQ